MGRKNKLMKFAEMRDYPNVFQNFEYRDPKLVGFDNKEVDYKGCWSSGYFKNDHPLVLELACGGGEYSLGMAALSPEKNFIGVDVKGARIYKGSSRAVEGGIQNVAFVRTRIEQLHLFFGPGEVHEIWITFPDPFLRYRKLNRRLTSTWFIDVYKKVLLPGGLIHLKTDDDTLFKFTLDTIQTRTDVHLIEQIQDVYSQDSIAPELEIKTYYEGMHLTEGKTIKYVKFSLEK